MVFQRIGHCLTTGALLCVVCVDGTFPQVSISLVPEYRQSAPSCAVVIKSQPVSRVLSRIIIHLDVKSPLRLKQPTRKQRGPRHCFPIWSCSEWGLPCRFCYQKRGALLPHHFTLTSKVLKHVLAVYFLLHWPWTRVPQTLSGTLPCGARTFLQPHNEASDYPADLARHVK